MLARMPMKEGFFKLGELVKEAGLGRNYHEEDIIAAIHKYSDASQNKRPPRFLPHHVSTQNIRGVTYDPAAPQVGGQGIPRNMTTWPQILKRQNYSSHFVGKWDAGFATRGHTPAGRGFGG